MEISHNVLKILAAKTYKGIGRKWINENIGGCLGAEDIVGRLAEKVSDVTVDGFESRCCQIRDQIESLGSAIDGAVGLGDPDFPLVASGVKSADRPIALFYKGDISLISSFAENVGVIGLLNPSEQILEDERRVVEKLVEQGKCIISGLALGCDTMAHRTTLDCMGSTVAFLAGPLNEINPPSNRGLAAEIVENGGLLVSEYYDKAHSRNEFLGRYPERDRLQAMFASCVILAASYCQKDRGCDSGSRFAMGKAKEYGVPRCVIYDRQRDASNPMFNLSREEMGDGAKVINPNGEWTLPAPRSSLQEMFLI